MAGVASAPMLKYPCRNDRKDADLTGEGSRTTDWDDNDFAEGMRRRDPKAVEALYNRYCRRAFGLAYRILGDGPSAEDVVQEAFLTVWRQADRIDSARGKLSSLLMTVVHHKAIDVLRSRRGQTARHLPTDPGVIEHAADTLDSVEQSLDREAVRDVLSALPPEQLEPIRLAYFEGLTHVEIAERLALPLGTVKSRLRLGLQKMRSALEDRVFK